MLVESHQMLSHLADIADSLMVGFVVAPSARHWLDLSLSGGGHANIVCSPALWSARLTDKMINHSRATWAWHSTRERDLVSRHGRRGDMFAKNWNPANHTLATCVKVSNILIRGGLRDKFVLIRRAEKSVEVREFPVRDQQRRCGEEDV